MTRRRRAGVHSARRRLRSTERRFGLLVALSTLFAALAACGSTTTKSGLKSIGSGISGPGGLVATVYARGLPHVSALAFDSYGRLWATTSGSSTHKGDGVYLVSRWGARPVKVVGGMVAPLGLAWVGNRLIVASLGRVTTFEGFDGARFRRRKVILPGPESGGENNNVILGADGRLVMGVSASCDHCVPATKWSGAIVSFRPDGSDLRLVARGIRAPFGLAYRRDTKTLYASMNQRDDLGSKTPGDWLAVVERGQDWGFPACYGQQTKACAGKPKPVGVLDAHAAAGGVALLNGELGGTYRSSALVAEWQFGVVKRVALGGGRDLTTTFLTGFAKPLPVLSTAGGAVLVGDWGRGIVYRISV